jgi:hypothetical protein
MFMRPSEASRKATVSIPSSRIGTSAKDCGDVAIEYVYNCLGHRRSTGGSESPRDWSYLDRLEIRCHGGPLMEYGRLKTENETENENENKIGG